MGQLWTLSNLSAFEVKLKVIEMCLFIEILLFKLHFIVVTALLILNDILKKRCLDCKMSEDDNLETSYCTSPEG